jgi:hypothetical protein
MPSTPALSMIEWRKCDQGMRAQPGTYDGLAGLGVDLLFLAGNGALEAVLAREEHPLGKMKRQLRAARIQFFVLRTKHELRALGYEDFVRRSVCRSWAPADDLHQPRWRARARVRRMRLPVVRSDDGRVLRMRHRGTGRSARRVRGGARGIRQATRDRGRSP